MTLTEAVIILKRLQWTETSIDKLGKYEFCIKQIIAEQNKRNRPRLKNNTTVSMRS